MAQLILIWEERATIFLCASTDVWEDLDPVVFPMLFLVKWSWLSM